MEQGGWIVTFGDTASICVQSLKNIKLPEGTHISIDGKKLRGSATKLEQQTARSEGGRSAIHLVQAWCKDLSLCLSVRQVDEKTNEIKGILVILNDLELTGCVVSIDAMGCQKEIVKAIMSKDANYVIGLKDNQPTLAQGVAEAFSSNPDQCTGTRIAADTGGDHGRIEERICNVLRIAHNLVKNHPDKISIRRKNKKAERSDHYREQILRLKRQT